MEYPGLSVWRTPENPTAQKQVAIEHEKKILE